MKGSMLPVSCNLLLLRSEMIERDEIIRSHLDQAINIVGMPLSIAESSWLPSPASFKPQT